MKNFTFNIYIYVQNLVFSLAYNPKSASIIFLGKQFNILQVSVFKGFAFLGSFSISFILNPK